MRLPLESDTPPDENCAKNGETPTAVDEICCPHPKFAENGETPTAPHPNFSENGQTPTASVEILIGLLQILLLMKFCGERTNS